MCMEADELCIFSQIYTCTGTPPVNSHVPWIAAVESNTYILLALAYGYLCDSTPQELSFEYQHAMV